MLVSYYKDLFSLTIQPVKGRGIPNNSGGSKPSPVRGIRFSLCYLKDKACFFPHIWWQRWDLSTLGEIFRTQEPSRTFVFLCVSNICSFVVAVQWCTNFSLCLFLFLFCRPSVESILKEHIREQMSKGLRSNTTTATEDMEGDKAPNVSEHEAGMLSMFRMLMEEQRKSDIARAEVQRRSDLAREEARIQEMERREEARILEAERKEEVKRREDEKKEMARVEREIEATKGQVEQQAALETRQYEQQMALLKIQAEIGERASMAHREGQSADRKRDRALFSISVMKDGEDLEEFLLTAERRLRAAGIKQEEWLSIIDSKLSGKLASAWQDITVTAVEYQEARDRLLKMCGYTPRLAADAFFGFRTDSSKGMTADQLYHRGQQLLRRMIAPGRVSEEVEFAILRGWVGSVIPKRAESQGSSRG